MFTDYGHEDESWADIQGFPNYLVSNFGRIWNAKHNRFLKPFYKFGYAFVCLYHNGESFDIRIHRLVAAAFLPTSLDRSEVNHEDGDKNYNYIENLEWATRSENMIHAFRTGLKIPTNRRPVRVIETGLTFESLTECANAIGGSPGNIRHCLMGKIKTHCGFTFEYIDKEVVE